MGKYFLYAPAFIIVFILSFIPGSNIVNTFGHIYDAPSGKTVYENAALPLSSSNGQRDFKIPDDTEDSTQNTTSGLRSTTLVPWKGPRLVVIDAGHGGTDPGSRSSSGLLEKDVTLDISQKLNMILKESGVNTYMIRDDDATIPHKDRILLANDKKAALYLSIHCDSFKDSSYNGTATLYYPSGSLAAGYLNEIEYAQAVQKELIKALGTKDRGINDRPDLAVLRHAKMPSVLVELAFLSNKSDAALLSSEEFRQKAAEALAEGIRKSLIKITVKKD